MAQKEDTERRIYVLPTELLARLRTYQNEDGINSEVEAVRRLLDSALQMRDTIFTIMAKLKAKYANEKNLRVLVRDILSVHPLVTKVIFEDDGVLFELRGHYTGKLSLSGTLTYNLPDDDVDYWRSYDSYLESQRPAAPKKTNAWESRPSADLDDEIPF